MTDRTERRIFITGLANPLAGALAARLERDERVSHLVGVDLQEPRHRLVRTEFIRADLRNPMIAKVVEATRVDTIVHLALTAAPGGAGGRGRMKELNVIGSMQLLAAAQRAPLLRRVVVRSSTAVYGSTSADPALFREDVDVGGAHSGYAKDAVEVEGYARGFARRREDATLTILRIANLIGPTVETPLTGYFALPVVPTVMGYDPRVQLCHEDDAVEVVCRSVLEEHPGIFNVAGPGILYLSQAARIAGKVSVPVPLPCVNSLAGIVRRAGLVDFPADQLRYLLYGRVGDITRLRENFGYEPVYSTRAAFEDFLRSRVITPLVDRQTALRWERGLHRVLIRALDGLR